MTRMQQRFALLFTFVVFLFVGVGVAQSSAPAPSDSTPTVSEADTLRYKVYLQQMQIAQLQAQAAQRDFDAAQLNIVALTDRLAKPGFTIDWQKGLYVPVPEPPQK